MSRLPGDQPPAARTRAESRRLNAGLDRLTERVRRSTGVKMFLWLTLALLPLGLIALFASLQAIRTADQEKTALLNLAATQSAKKLSTEIASDQSALELVANNFPAVGDVDVGFCTRTQDYLTARSDGHVEFLMLDQAGRYRCGTRAARAFQSILASGGTEGARLLPGKDTLAVRATSDDGKIMAFVLYDRAHLGAVVNGVSSLDGHKVELRQGSQRIVIGDSMTDAGRESAETASARVDPTDISLRIMIVDAPVTPFRALSLFLPLLMWFAAAAVGWYVVNRLLIKPLIELRRLVARYQPGEVLEIQKRIATPAHEIRDLADTFREISEDVSTHEAELAEGLARQRKLTREVHHRVKNNLQIIASLINLHSRAAATPEAAAAYGSIQRRVDALSVVHRNHYAELEENRGLSIRALISELSASLRGSAPEESHGFTIQVNSENLFVLQDVAVPVAFLITELVELALLVDPRATIRISVSAMDASMAELTLQSNAFRTSRQMDALVEKRFERVLTGLSRQLRSPLRHDGAGSYAITVAAVA